MASMEGGHAMSAPKFVFNNCLQCWHCKHRDGWVARLVSGYPFKLPICKIEDCAMMEVSHNPCDCFKSDGQEATTACLDGADKQGVQDG